MYINKKFPIEGCVRASGSLCVCFCARDWPVSQPWFGLQIPMHHADLWERGDGKKGRAEYVRRTWLHLLWRIWWAGFRSRLPLGPRGQWGVSETNEEGITGAVSRSQTSPQLWTGSSEADAPLRVRAGRRTAKRRRKKIDQNKKLQYDKAAEETWIF